ncbi:MAG TPA: cation:proton antiporter [Streptomyces sp.]
MTAAEQTSRLLLALPCVILVCHLGGAAARRLGQPAVMGEIVAGILLGPSLLSGIWPRAKEYLLPPEVLGQVGSLGQLGLLVFMFLTGLSLDPGHLRGRGRVAVAVSQAGIALPFALGALLATAMYGPLAPHGVGRPAFVLFVAVAMSITAFPVLARILVDRGLYRTPLGSLAMACAAVDDVTAWCLLALVTALARGGTPADTLWTVFQLALYLALMIRVVRPLWAKALDAWSARERRGASGFPPVAALFCGVCLSSYATDRIGVHALFGAFVFGAVTPAGSEAVRGAADVLRSVAVPVLLPLFFLTAGLNTDVGTLARDPAQWLWLGAVLLVAFTGKWGGATLAARACGQPWRESLALGALMNCRGLTELIVLNTGLSLGVLSRSLFTLLVLMALITTSVTSPALGALGHGSLRDGGDTPPVPHPAGLPQESR